MISNEITITFAINALENLRRTEYIDNDIKQFTHIVEALIKPMEWKDIKEEEECCRVLYLALKEWKKKISNTNPNGCELAFIGIKSYIDVMLRDLTEWLKKYNEDDT